MEITKKIQIDKQLEFELEMHSVINLITIITSTLQIMQIEAEDKLGLNEVTNSMFDVAGQLADLNEDTFDVQLLESTKEMLVNALTKIPEINPDYSASTSFATHKHTLNEIVTIFNIRLGEVKERLEKPNSWVTFDVDEFREDFKRFFHALEVNSRGRYRIIYNIAEQEVQDYLVNFEIKTDEGNQIKMPILFKDVVRDLIANARKYTPPGGSILIGIAQKNKTLRFVIEDSGYGIPSNEIEKVVEYGFRGTNVRDTIRTMGGGFGLTKAYHITKKLGGRLFIESEVNRGTVIKIEIPVP